MRHLVTVCLLVVAVIHALPIVGVIGASKLSSLYGITVQDPNLEILLRHRAVLFGLLAAFFALAAFRPELRLLAFVAGAVSVASFMWLAFAVGSYNPALAVIVKADLLAAAALALAAALHFLTPSEA